MKAMDSPIHERKVVSSKSSDGKELSYGSTTIQNEEKTFDGSSIFDPSKLEGVDINGDLKKKPEADLQIPPVTPKGVLPMLWWLISTAVAEPYFFLFIFSTACKSNAYTLLVKEKVCLFDLNYTRHTCDNLHNHTDEENAVQRMTNNINMGHSVIVMLPAIVAVIFLGSFADKYGRKLPVFLATLGLLAEMAGIVFCVLDFERSATMLLVVAIPGGITGGIIVSMVVVMTYVSETSAPENRTIRFAFMDIAITIAMPAGVAYGGTTFEMFESAKKGYLFVFTSAFIALLLGVIWIMFRLKEPNKQKMTDWRQVIKDLTSLSNVKDNIRTCTKKRPGNCRLQLWLLFLSMAVSILCIMGTATIGFMFVMKMYDWKIGKYSLVTTYTSLIQAVCIGVAVPLMTKVLKAHDSILMLVGTLCSGASFVFKAFAYQQWMYYVGCFAGLFGGIGSIGTRSRLSKLVHQSELGKVFSVMAMCESIPPIVGAAVFTQIYNASIGFFPGMVYLTVAGSLIIPCIVAIYIFRYCSEHPYVELPEDKIVDDDSTSKI